MGNAQEIILEGRNIQKSFGNHAVHQGISFTLKKGESLGLLGGSGTGKSVLLRSVIGLEDLDGGEILFRGTRIDDLNEKDYTPYRIKISYAFQTGALFDSMNVFENVAFTLYEHTDYDADKIEDLVAKMLKMVDLEGKEHLMPSDLSGGMQKRVGMARAMIMGPEIILYDEPTAGLDPNNTLNVVDIMQRFKKTGQTSIFVTHDIPSAMQICDRILILKEGKIIFDDSTLAFKNSSDPYVRQFIQNKGY